jgi:hypothetical protein
MSDGVYDLDATLAKCSREELEECVRQLVRLAYYGVRWDGETVWNPDNELDADFIQGACEVLSQFVPSVQTPAPRLGLPVRFVLDKLR